MQDPENPQTVDTLRVLLKDSFEKEGDKDCDAGFEIPYEKMRPTCVSGETEQSLEALINLQA